MNYEFLCTDCLTNESLIRYVRIKECPICHSHNKFAITLSDLTYYLDSCISHNYSDLDYQDGTEYDPERNCFYYIDTDDEVELTDIYNILGDNDVLDSSINHETRTEIYEALFNSIYPARNIYSYLAETGWVHATSNDLFFTWESFNYLIQNNNRFFDFIRRSRSEYLDKIFSLLSEFEEEIPANTVLFRVRNDKSLNPNTLDNVDSALKEIAPAPCKYTQSYRMSPKGISYTYLSTEIKTCLMECKTHIHDITLIGKFKVRKPLRILNLEVKEYPYNNLFSGHFDREKEDIGYFIERYSSEISKQEHDYEYLPTQVIAEYIRLQGYDGIAYSSAKTKATNYVFFYGPDYYKFSDIKPKSWNYYIDSVPHFTDILELKGCALCEITNSKSYKYNIIKSILDF